MNKSEFITALQSYIKSDQTQWKGQEIFGNYLIYYLKNLDIPHSEKHHFWRIEPYLPQILSDAFESMRTSESEAASFSRTLWEKELQRPVPNIIDLGTSSMIDQQLTIQTVLCYLISSVTEQDWIEGKIYEYFNAQQYVLSQTFDKFARSVIAKGLFKLIDESQRSGFSGTFGSTQLRSFMTAGRVMFTFARVLDGEEISVSFVGLDDDPIGLQCGLQSAYANLQQSIAMIEEVTSNWPADIEAQKLVFTSNEAISMA